LEYILVDTSVWINFFKDIQTKSSDFLNDNLANIIITTCPTIVQEVLQGIVSDKDRQIIGSYFNNFTHLIEDPYQVAIEAADLYRKLRKEGITIRKPNDCLIAAYAIKNDLVLLHDDKDFEFIASKSGLDTVKF
jgi:predicted nucleic acid-binding protein